MKSCSALLLCILTLFGLIFTTAWGRPLAGLIQVRDEFPTGVSGSSASSTISAVPSSGEDTLKPGGNIDLTIEIEINSTSFNGGQIAGITIGVGFGLPLVGAILYFIAIGLWLFTVGLWKVIVWVCKGIVGVLGCLCMSLWMAIVGLWNVIVRVWKGIAAVFGYLWKITTKCGNTEVNTAFTIIHMFDALTG